MRVIRADEVRYPGVELPPIDGSGNRPDEYELWKESGRTFRPARDTGLALEGRRSREARRKAAQRRQQVFAGVLAVVVLGSLLVAWQYASDRRAATEPLDTALAVPAPIERTTAPSADLPVAIAADPAADPTPYFASYKKLKLRLPVAADELTEIGFHQASYAYALRLKSLLPDAKMTSAKKDRSTHRDLSTQSTEDDAVLVGTALRMWRNRPGKPDTAVDIGADPGSAVYSPVTGTVVKVKRYKLYNQWNDYELHIQPDGRPELDLVMIHIDDVTVRPGDRVVAGISQLAVVRKLAKAVGPQLRSYTRNGGHHTHLQVNDATDPKYKGLKDALRVYDPSQSATRQPLDR